MSGLRTDARISTEMYVKLNGEMVYLWRAVDQEGEILES
jgi:putative transposase